MPFDDDTSTRSWNAVADDWIAHADRNDYRNCYLMPRMLTMLGNVEGKKILDLGCGEGGYARELARRGASVTGVDGSDRLIEAARQRSKGETRVSFVHANANALDISAESFDVVLASMSLMDVEDYDGAIREVHRVLRPAGELLMSITHPCFSAPVSKWIRNAAGDLDHSWSTATSSELPGIPKSPPTFAIRLHGATVRCKTIWLHRSHCLSCCANSSSRVLPTRKCGNRRAFKDSAGFHIFFSCAG